MPVKIRKVTDMPPTRPNLYCLGLQDDSVFADFDADADGCIFLVRISFDGYGCYGTGGNATRMTASTSKKFVRLIESNELECAEFESILTDYFRMNKEVIGNEQLAEYDLT